MTEEKQGPVPPSPATDEPSPWALAGLGMQFFVAVFLFVYAGNWIDARFGTSPLFLLIGVFAGGGGTFFVNYRRLMRTMQGSDTRATKDSDHSPRA